ncbi:hypothetical protein BH23ACT12_BH23ACT12_16620 [soil metagenome]
MTGYQRILLMATVGMVLAACGDSGSTNAAESPVGETQPATPTVAGTGQCSAAGVEVEVPESPDLPNEVLSIRNEIIQTALRCDYDALQELAMRPTGSFQYSKIEESAGPEATPAQFWREREQAGERVLASLVEILVTDPEIQPVTDPEGPGTGPADSYFNFPGAAVAEEEQQYQTSITSRGDWIFFLKTDEATPTPSD